MDINIASSTAAVRKTPVVQSPAELTAANEDAHTNKCIVCECTTWHSPSIVTLAWWKKNNISYPLMKIAGKHWECMFGKGSLHSQALQTELKGGNAINAKNCSLEETTVWHYLGFLSDTFLWPHIISVSFLLPYHPLARDNNNISPFPAALSALFLLMCTVPPLPLLPYLLLFISSTVQTLCLTGAPITVPRMHHCSISL